MRSFHQWMQCQQYESHLKNLIRIKQSPSTIGQKTLKQKQLSKSLCFHKRPFSISSLNYHKKKGPQICLRDDNREQTIYKQNALIAQRIINTPSVISRCEQIQSYNKMHAIVKKSPNNKKQEEKKEKKLQNFIRIRQEGISACIVRITFLRVPRIQQRSQKLYKFKLILQNQEIRSVYKQNSEILLEQISFPLKNKLINKTGYIEMGCCLGLRYIDLGRYKIVIPGYHQKYELQVSSEKDPEKQITVLIHIDKKRKIR